jgi:hypothetical protein
VIAFRGFGGIDEEVLFVRLVQIQTKVNICCVNSGPALRFGLPKPVPILIAHLLFNTKKKKKKKKKSKIGKIKANCPKNLHDFALDMLVGWVCWFLNFFFFAL